MPSVIKRIIRPILDFIYPPRCVFCDDRLGTPHPSTHWCIACERSIARVEGDFNAPRLKRVWFDRARSALSYEGRVKEAVHGFKYAQRFDLVRAFATLLYEEACRCDDAEMVMPVPLHPARLRSRGYNQSALIARALARRCGMRFDARSLMRLSNTPPQVDQELSRRLVAMRNAFGVRDAARVKGVRIIVVDDVLTTGATVNECARVLKKAGAARVDVLTIARVL